jgi:ribonuclease R
MTKTRETIRKELLSLFRNHGSRAFRPKEVVKRLGYTDNTEYQMAREVLDELAERGEIKAIKGNRYTFKAPSGLMEGRLTVHPDGYGFVKVEGHEQDFFVRSRRMNTAMDGDTVRIGLAAGSRGDTRRQAEIIAVLKRGRTTAVGTFHHAKDFAYVVPDDKRLTHDIFVQLDSIGKAVQGDKVMVSIEGFEHKGAAPRGRILKVIGKADDPGVNTLALAMSMGVDVDFEPEVLEEANAISGDIPKSEVKKREDFRHRTVFTIDPEDAKDFDDALHIEPLGDDRFEIGVHIADVSHYVQPGTHLDAAAYARGTSVYLVDRVIPMLPHNLSNGICSLRPNEDRLAFSCLFEMDLKGNVHRFEVKETIIRSAFRLSYEEAQEIIAGNNPEHPLNDSLTTLAGVAKKLRDARFENGSINFDLQEVRVELDETGHPIRVVPRLRQESNKLIEEYMLLANRQVASRYGQKKHVFAFRIHEPPDADRIMNLAKYVSAFGHQLPHNEGLVTPSAINALLASVEGKPEAAVVEQAALRSMSRARYDVNSLGHYGLGADFYTHFTSPIRRYPDLVVHRLVKDRLAGNKEPEAERIADMMQHCSEQEVKATEAERESVQLKKVEFALDHVGETFNGVIAGVSKFGLYIELEELLVEGMVHVRNMNDDYYEYDEKSFSLIGTRSGKRFKPGDSTRVLIAGANVEKREIDLEFVR